MVKKISKKAATEMLAEIDELYQDAVDAMQVRRDATLENMSFYIGYQYSVRDGSYIDNEDSPSGEAMETRNIIQPIVRASVASTLKQKINPEMPSFSGDQRSRAKADATERLCKSFEHNGVIDYDELHRLLSWSKIVGLGWMKVFWNPDAGRALPDDEPDGFENLTNENSDEFDYDAFGERVVEQLYEGEIQTEFVPSTDGMPDPSVRSKRELRQPGAYFIHKKLRTVRELEDRFAEDMFGESTNGRWAGGKRTAEQRISDPILSQDGLGRGSKYSDKNTLAELVEFWQNPTREYPRGRLCIFSGGMILYLGKNPYKHRRIPFLPLAGDNLVPGSLHAEGVVSNLKNIQRSINRTATKEREWVDRILNARMYVPLGSGIDPDTFEDIPGQVVPYTKGLKPETERPPEIPNSMFTYYETLLESAKYVSGYGDVSQGGIPPNIQSGRAIAFARENEQTMREPDMLSYRIFLVDLFQMCLDLAKQFYDEGRMIRTMGPDGKWEMVEFTSDDYDFSNDLVPEVFSGGPNSHALRFAEVLEMYQLQMFADTPEAKSARRALGDNYVNRATFEKHPEARAKTKRHILNIMKEPWKEIEVKPWDNHELALELFNAWRQTQEYEELPEWQRAIADKACEMHEYFYSLQNQALSEDQQLLNGPSGGPGGGPVASPPGGAPPGLESPHSGSAPGAPPYPTQSQVPPQEHFVRQESQQLGVRPPSPPIS